MFKKVFFMSLVLFGLLFSQISVECFADATAQLEQATTYIEENQFEQATAIYESILSSQPDKKTEVLARGGLIVADIHRGKIETVETAVVKLINDYSDTITVSEAAFDIAQAFGFVGKWEKASELYQYILDTWPSSEDFAPAKAGMVKSNIMLGNIDEADSDVEKLISDLPEHERITGALKDIADCYRSAGEYDKACQLYQFVIDTWPNSDEIIWALSGIGVAQARLGNNDKVKAVIEQLLSDFSGHPSLGELILAIAEPYYDEAFRKQSEGLTSQASSHFQMAVAICEMVKSRVPGFVADPETYSWEGACYRELGEYEKSIECYQKVVDDYPGYDMAWYALFMVGRSYEDLKESGVISESEADSVIRAVYEQLLEDYPDCKAARIAQRWLSSHNST